MKRVRLFTLFVMLAHCCLVPTAQAQSIADLKKVVAFIFGTITVPGVDQKTAPNKVDMALGTGFFVAYPDPRGGPAFSFGYLVTAKHVLKGPDGSFLSSVKLRLNLKTPTDDTGVQFSDQITVADANGKLLWLHSSNDADDVAAIPLLPNENIADFKALPVSMFATDESLKSDDVQEGDSLLFVGLMPQFYGTKRNYPVVRRGALALMTDEDIPTPTGLQKVFLAELQSWPGNSGSPVFLNLSGYRNGALVYGGSLRFLGIMLGDFLNTIPGSVNGGPTRPVGGDASNIGVSFILPAAKIKGVLDSAEAQQLRDAEIERRKTNK